MERMRQLSITLLVATTLSGCSMIPGFGDDEDEDRGPSINMPGVHVGPDGVQAPGVSVTPQGVQAPGVNVTPQGVQIGGAAPAVGGATGVPPSFGIPECDEYARRSCSCSNNLVRAQLCATAQASFASWSQVARSAPSAIPGLTEGCRSAAASLVQTCGQ